MKGQWGKLVGYFVATLIISAAGTFGLPLLGGGSWLPDLLSREGGAIDELFWGLTIISLIIFAMVAAFVIYAMVHFRAEPGDLSDGEHIHGNARLEVVWIVVPTIIVAVIAILSYIVLEDNEIGLYDKAAAKDKGAATLAVDVRGFSFGWNFRYEDLDGAKLTGEDAPDASPELVLPKGQVVRFNVLSCSGKEHLGRLEEQVRRELETEGKDNEFAEIEPGICEKEWDSTTAEDQAAAEETATKVFEARRAKADGDDLSKEQKELLESLPAYHGDQQHIDVNHAFWVPEARLKIDAIAGLRTYVQWQPTRTTRPDDNYQVVCAELCGSGHNGMRSDMCVIEQDAFDWWLGLSEEERQDATCANLRVFNCFEGTDDFDELLENVAQITKEDPEAGCREAQEALA
ncbi:MAG: cytochrome c oxidase, subunit [Thermoleophilia bacterium]|nr:cytochrome c oxidase, subunit [Thermoleophilia bacterium]MCZ4496766.1 cytochrome c oxidase, subunit [Thermoleophilia bacterium]